MNIAVATITGAAALESAPALASTVEPDAKLRDLWKQYLDARAAVRHVRSELDSAQTAYDVEAAPRPLGVLREEHDRALSEKHGLNRLRNAWNDDHRRLYRIIKAVQTTNAEDLFGIGVRLAVQPYLEIRNEDKNSENVIKCALSDIDRQLGTNFVAALPENWGNDWAEWEDDEDEDAS